MPEEDAVPVTPVPRKEKSNGEPSTSEHPIDTGSPVTFWEPGVVGRGKPDGVRNFGPVVETVTLPESEFEDSNPEAVEEEDEEKLPDLPPDAA
jgi:hypothetical protein